MSQDTVITITPRVPNSVFWYFVTTTVMMAPALVGPPVAWDKQDMVLPTPLVLRDMRVVGLATVL